MRLVDLLGRCSSPRPTTATATTAFLCRPPSSRLFHHTHLPHRSRPSGRQSQSPPRLLSRSWQQACGAPRFVLKASSSSAGGAAGAAAAAGTLGAAAFIELSRPKDDADDDDGSDSTGERRMLAVSLEEMRRRRMYRTDSPDAGGAWPAILRMAGYLDVYVLEPVLTAVRFLHLVVIFVPVMAAVPAVWFGRRVGPMDNERTGTLWWYGFLVRAMEMAGPTFIKLGQWAASRTDLFPAELCAIMSKLHSNAPAHSMPETRHILASSFPELDLDDIFEEFDPEPLGVGAIAQVYRARLRPGLAFLRDTDLTASGAPPASLTRDVVRSVETVLKYSPRRVPSLSPYVAVKVLHPRAERVVRRDLRIMAFFAAVLNAVPTIEWLSLPDEVAQFGEMMRLQLDLRIEAANLTRFRQNFQQRTTAWFPYPYVVLTTRSVLVEEFAQGMPLADFIECGAGVFQHDVAGEGLDAFLRMLILDNFVHADLHPGNIMVRFYQPSKPGYMRLSGSAGPSKSSPSSSSSQSSEMHADDQDDVTDRVLSRLRPLRKRHDPAGWLAELAAIDAEGYRPQLIFIDAGLVTELSATNRANFLDLFRAIAEFDGYKAGVLMCERCRQPDAVIDKDVFALKMQNLILSVKSRTLALGNLRIGDLLQEVLAMVRAHHVRLEGDFVNVVVSILLLEGIGRSLDPKADLLSSSLPILRQVSARGGAEMAKQGDFGLIMLWVGLETRRFLQASIEDVERCVKYDLLSPNV